MRGGQSSAIVEGRIMVMTIQKKTQSISNVWPRHTDFRLRVRAGLDRRDSGSL